MHDLHKNCHKLSRAPHRRPPAASPNHPGPHTSTMPAQHLSPHPHLTSSLSCPALKRARTASFSTGGICPCSRPQSSRWNTPSSISRSSSWVAALTSSWGEEEEEGREGEGTRHLASPHHTERMPYSADARSASACRPLKQQQQQESAAGPMRSIPAPLSPFCRSAPQRGTQCRRRAPCPSPPACAHTSAEDKHIQTVTQLLRVAMPTWAAPT